jgi:hypothetical protein
MSGHLKTDDGDIKTFPSTRMDALADILDEHSGKSIIWSRFRYDIINIVAMLNKRYGEGTAPRTTATPRMTSATGSSGISRSLTHVFVTSSAIRRLQATA